VSCGEGKAIVLGAQGKKQTSGAGPDFNAVS